MLNSLENYKSAFNLTKLVTIVAIVGSFSFAGFVWVKSQQQLDFYRKYVYVLTKSGDIYIGESKNSDETRIFEYNDAIRDVYTLWYSFDENSYQRNIEKALYLLGNCGKKMKADYDAEGILTKLREKNLVLSVTITDLKINVKNKSGYITGIQTIAINENVVKRNMNAQFTLFDVDRSDNNPHGVKFDNWTVTDQSVIKDNQ